MKLNAILVAYKDGVLAIWRTRERGWVEVRGELDKCASDPLQAVIDRLSGPLVGGELMAGNIAVVNERMYTDDYPILDAILKECQ